MILILVHLACAAALGAAPSTVHFLSRDEARQALTTGADRDFYAHLQLVEMRAKTGLALKATSLEAAREQVMASYGGSVEEFTADEQAALRDATDHLQPILESQAPLYARTPWSFIKVKANIEGGLPHTRGDSIVLAEPVLASLVRAHATRAFDQPSPVWALLVHEQTHVIQRRHPGMFATLYTGVFGFQHVDLPTPPEWIAAVRMTNPDAPISDWVFALGKDAGQRWMLPEILVDHGDHPQMPADFRVVAVRVEHHGASWVYADQSAPAETVVLDSLQEYVERFPVRDELFHPNEIAAGMLSYLIIGASLPNPENAMWSLTRTWAAQSLR
jgi:hypothetical protein